LSIDDASNIQLHPEMVIVLYIIVIILFFGLPALGLIHRNAQPTNACQNVPLMIAASTTTGGCTIRFREGSYVSPPIAPSSAPQTVVFPRPRSMTAPIDEAITIEGNATDVVTTFPVSHLQRVYPKVTGILAISAHWQALKPCQARSVSNARAGSRAARGAFHFGTPGRQQAMNLFGPQETYRRAGIREVETCQTSQSSGNGRLRLPARPRPRKTPTRRAA
jgi:hypothetical protein